MGYVRHNMRKHIPIPIFAALVISLFIGITADAANSTSASVPVMLTVANEVKTINVTVPTSLPVEIRNGKVITASDACIKNNSKSGSVRVTDVTVSSGAYTVGDYDNFSGYKTIALKINGIPTRGAGTMSITRTAFPDIKPGSSQKMTYDAKVSSDTGNVQNVAACTVVFTISSSE